LAGTAFQGAAACPILPLVEATKVLLIKYPHFSHKITTTKDSESFGGRV